MANQCLCWVTVHSVQMPGTAEPHEQGPSPTAVFHFPPCGCHCASRGGRTGRLKLLKGLISGRIREIKTEKLDLEDLECHWKNFFLHKPKVEIRLIDFWQSSGVDMKKLLAHSVWTDLYLAVTAVHYDWQSPSTQFTPTRHCPPSSPWCSWPLYKSPPTLHICCLSASARRTHPSSP